MVLFNITLGLWQTGHGVNKYWTTDLPTKAVSECVSRGVDYKTAVSEINSAIEEVRHGKIHDESNFTCFKLKSSMGLVDVMVYKEVKVR